MTGADDAMKRILRTLMLLLASLIALSPAAAQEDVGPYRLGTGDEVKIFVFGLDAANGSYALGDGGSISLPLIGAVPAAGRTLPELEVAIGEALKAKQIIKEPSVSAQMVKYRPFYILGEVQKPGQYAYAPGMTVIQAVSMAGGYTFRANEKKATISRPGNGQAVKSTVKPDARVLPGDTVIIAEAWF